MALQYTARFKHLFSPLMPENGVKVLPVPGSSLSRQQGNSSILSFPRREANFCLPLSKMIQLPSVAFNFTRLRYGATRNSEKVSSEDDDGLMDDEERRDWRKKIREVIDNYPNVQEEMDPEEKRKRMQRLLADYPLVEEDDPDWPEDADGRGFNLDQFFNKITIKNVGKDDDDDENYDSDKEIVWQDDDYIRPIKDMTSKEWEETVFKDISPLIILVHNRYKRPKENEQCRDELEKAVNIIWNCRLPSPRCVAIDAVVDSDLASVLRVSIFPELIFTKAGKIVYREKAIRPADELSRIMAFFYYGAAKPPFFDVKEKSEESIPSAPISTDPS